MDFVVDLLFTVIALGWTAITDWNTIENIWYFLTDRTISFGDKMAVLSLLWMAQSCSNIGVLYLGPVIHVRTSKSDCGITFDSANTQLITGGMVHLGGSVTATGTLDIDAAESISFESDVHDENTDLKASNFQNGAFMHAYYRIDIEVNKTANNCIISVGEEKPEKIYEMLETATTLAPTNNLTNTSTMATILTSSTTLEINLSTVLILVIFIFCKIF